jgi:heterodisulfide reductase subunit A
MGREEMKDKIGAVMVVGGGVAGIQTSLDLAEAGLYVYLVESSPSIGGVMAQLDKTFPTNDCAMCILSPKLVEASRHLNIEVLTDSEVVGATGNAGDFRVRVRRKPRYVNLEKCTGCGDCVQACVFKKGVPSQFEEGLVRRKAIYIPFPQAAPLKAVVDRENCLFLSRGKCTQACLKACKAGAIEFEQQEEVIEKRVGSIILSPGFDEFDAGRLPAYGFGRFPNVVSSIQLERILSASGPFQGNLRRPSDATAPKKIAWIQCVGSRDMSEAGGNPYCSSVCCMYAIKEAVIAKEHSPEMAPTIFYTDIRTQGKDFDAYYERAKSEYGVRFVRSQVSRVEERPKSKNLMIHYIDGDRQWKEEEFDLVVLSIGLTASAQARALAQRLGLELEENGFCKTDEYSRLSTSRPGIYVSGAFQGPKDIPETVAQASASAVAASILLAPARWTLTRKKEYPAEIDIRGQEPRIGVFLCHCGVNIGSVVNVPEVKEYARTLEGVEYVEESLYTCSQTTQQQIKKIISEHRLNRVMIASCSPRTHEPMFQQTLADAGLNKYLFEMANIRDQCSWVHMHQPEEATRKAKELVRMAVAKVRLLQPLREPQVEVEKKGLIIGGGLTGMRAALDLAQQGFECVLLEREEELGGNLRHLYYTLEGNDPQQLLAQTVQEVRENPSIQVLTGAELKNISGYLGNFKSVLAGDGTEREFKHGVVIVAVGGKERTPTEYLYGKDPRIITQSELEERIAHRWEEIDRCRRIVMIQCVGSRTPERPNCSRICCLMAVKNALKIKERNPEIGVTVLYRDIRTYGLMERHYTRARELGVQFVSFDAESPPEVKQGEGPLQVSVKDSVIGEEVTLSSELLVLSSAIVPHENEALAKMLKVPLTADGLFLEAHAKLRPVDFATDGIFLAGLAHFPKNIGGSISQADAAAARATAAIAKGYVTALPTISVVDPLRCVGCGLCEQHCAFNAIRVVETDRGRKAETIAASCKGCGVCSAGCPQKAVTIQHFSDDQIAAQIEALASEKEAAG